MGVRCVFRGYTVGNWSRITAPFLPLLLWTSWSRLVTPTRHTICPRAVFSARTECPHALWAMRNNTTLPEGTEWRETCWDDTPGVSLGRNSCMAQHKSILSIIRGPSCSQDRALWELIVALSHQGTLKEQDNEKRGPQSAQGAKPYRYCSSQGTALY